MVMPTSDEETNVIEAINLMLGAAERLSNNPQHRMIADTLVFFSSRLAGVDTTKQGCNCGSGGGCCSKQEKDAGYTPIVEDSFYSGRNRPSVNKPNTQRTPNYPSGVVGTEKPQTQFQPQTRPSTSTPTLMLLAPHSGVTTHRWMDKEARIAGPLKSLTKEEHAKCMNEIVTIINKVKEKLLSSR